METAFENDYGKIEYVSGSDIYENVKVVKATAKAGHQFVCWEGDIAAANIFDNPLTVDFTAGVTYKQVNAVFKQDVDFALVAKPVANGKCTVSIDGSDSSIQTATAAPANGYRFKYWRGDGITAANKYSNPLAMTLDVAMSTAEIEAVFEEDPAYTKITKDAGDVAFVFVKKLEAAMFGRFAPATTADTTIKKVELGTAVEEIGEACFANCVCLQSVSFRTDNKAPYKASLKNIGAQAFYKTYITSFDFSRISGTIGAQAFANTWFTSVDLSGSKATQLQNSSFSNCARLTSVIFPATLTSIGANVFSGCDKLANIDLRAYRNSIPAIYGNSFIPVEQVPGRKFHFYSITEARKAFDDAVWSAFQSEFDPVISVDTILKFAVANAGSYIKYVQFKAYKLANNLTTNVSWGDSSISSKQWGVAGNFTTFKHEYTTNLTAAAVSVDNTISYFEYNGTVAAVKRNPLIAIEQFGSNITALTNGFVIGSKIASIAVPATVKYIANGAFYKCDSLDISNISSQNGLPVGKSWLVHNGTLANVLQDNTVTDFNAANVAQLTHVQAQCFNKCSALTAASFPQLTSIDAPLFNGTTKIKSLNGRNDGSVTIGNTYYAVTVSTNSIDARGKQPITIDKGCFLQNESQTISLYNVARIRMNAFKNCYQLQALHIYDSSVSIDKYGEWLFGGVEPKIVNKDEKYQYRKIQLQVNGDSAEAIMLTDSNGYVLKPLNSSKVRLITVSNDYAQNSRWSILTGMTNDSDRFASLLKDFAGNVQKLKNSAATRTAVINAITEAVDSMQEDELLIFHDSGHGGGKENTIDDGESGYISYMCLYNNTVLYDYEFWNLIKNAKCRVMAIFCTCHSGTMYKAPSLDQYAACETQNTQIRSTSWASSARSFFMDGIRPRVPVKFAASTDAADDTGAEEDDDVSPRLCVYAACADDEVSYMTPNVGHDLMTSLINNFKRNDMLDSYTSLFENSTTEHERSRLNDEGATPEKVNPEMFVDPDFNADIRAFT